MTTNQPSDGRTAEAMALLQEAHQRLLDSNAFGADVLVYRAILCLSGAPVPRPHQQQAASAMAARPPAHA